jgi:hypothetical protein
MKPEPTAALLIFIVCQEEEGTNSACVSVSRGNRAVNCVNEPDRELITKQRNHESSSKQNRSTYVRVDPVLGRPPAMGHDESLSSSSSSSSDNFYHFVLESLSQLTTNYHKNALSS